MNGEEGADLRQFRFTAPMRRKMLRRVEGMIARLHDPRSLRLQFLGVTEEDLTNLCNLIPETLINEPLCLDINLEKPLYIIGSIRGQFNTLLQIFDRQGRPSETQYLFLGDYTDDTERSIEVFALLFGYKVLYPGSIYLLRGKFESSVTAKFNGFYNHVMKRFSSRIWIQLTRAFDYLPYAAVVEDCLLCTHGGLSPLLKFCKQNTVQHLKEFLGHSTHRPVPFEPHSLLTHMVWASPDETIDQWEQNPAGLGYLFGPQVVGQFCEQFGLTHLVTSSEMSPQGYTLFAESQLLNLFTATEIQHEGSNDGSYLYVQRSSGGKLRAKIIVVKPVMRLRYSRPPIFQELNWDINKKGVSFRFSQSKEMVEA